MQESPISHPMVLQTRNSTKGTVQAVGRGCQLALGSSKALPWVLGMSQIDAKGCNNEWGLQ